jgi:hypothetical protein
MSFGPTLRNGISIALGATVSLATNKYFSPGALFLPAGTIAGAWFDPSDISTLFQDSVGTTPVTALGNPSVEQPVGLMLDKSQGLALGAQVLTNNGFATDLSGWTVSVSGGNTITWVAGGAQCVGDGVGLCQLIQTPGFTAGATYRVSITSTRTAGAGTYRVQGGPFPTATLIPTDGSTATFTLLCPSNSALTFTTNSGASTYVIRSISIQLLSGNHATQATAGNRPTYRARYNLLTWSEDFSNAAWTKSGTSTVTGTQQLNFPVGTDWIYATAVVTGTLAGATYTLGMQLSGSGTISIGMYDNISAGQVSLITLTATPTWYYVTKTFGVGSTDRRVQIGRVNGGTATLVNCSASDFRVGSLASITYQSITTATSYNAVGFLPYLAFNGTSSAMATASIAFTAAQMSVFAGVTKPADTPINGTVVELSVAGDINAGGFILRIATGGVANYGWFARSASNTDAPTIAVAAPDTSVLTFQTDLSAPTDNWRRNGGSLGTNAAPVGGGTFGNYPLFLGSRNNSTSLWANVNLYSLIVRGASSTAAEIASTEGWVNSRTGAY